MIELCVIHKKATLPLVSMRESDISHQLWSKYSPGCFFIYRAQRYSRQVGFIGSLKVLFVDESTATLV